ncbi:MBL fold metallo-hydrolase [Herbaspirillum lusitanum]|uniref:MBL fold metallo-hydrolase n=1 Tax=Herbaspirillum lusitanum TaxID=213312 RepID=UPI0022375CE6|nr:MBL fold metallo-hydrolase [Herbaspirillum lusitanum]MCW5297881.1 MBL fold metallo-hydrolase [Herbaspirillum lusitanum]
MKYQHSLASPRSLALYILLAMCLLLQGAVHAAAPFAGTSAPGFYRFMLGGFEITALNDGTLELPVDQFLTNITPQKTNEVLAAHYLESPLETSYNAFLINTGGKLILIDTGAGNIFGPRLGKLAANMSASGYTPSQVDEIYITHMHADHIGGLTTDGKMNFSNAIIRANRTELDYWLSEASMAKAPGGNRGDQKGTYRRAMTIMAPYIKAGRIRPFDGEEELTPGIRAYQSAGHTPGHVGYMIESQGNRLMVVGDIIHVAAIQFQDPTVSVAFDSDSKQAEKERIKEFTSIADGKILFAAAHVPFPGLGRLRAKQHGFQWFPVNYSAGSNNVTSLK